MAMTCAACGGSAWCGALDAAATTVAVTASAGGTMMTCCDDGREVDAEGRCVVGETTRCGSPGALLPPKPLTGLPARCAIASALVPPSICRTPCTPLRVEPRPASVEAEVGGDAGGSPIDSIAADAAALHVSADDLSATLGPVPAP